MIQIINTIIRVIQESKPTDNKRSANFDFDDENNEKDPLFRFGDLASTSKNEYIFGKSYTRNQPGEIVPWTCVIEGFSDE